MREKNPAVKSFAISALMAGQTYRQVQDAIQDTFGESVAAGTLNLWAHEDPEQAQAISRAHLQSIAHQRIRIAHKAGDLLEQRLDNGDVPHPDVTFGIASDKLDSMIRITQDEKKSNSLLDQLRTELRQKPADELRAMLAATADTSPAKEPPSRGEIERYHGLHGEKE
jgi:hypothetical protein